MITKKKKPVKKNVLSPEEKFWEEVDKKAHYLIYHALIRQIPFSGNSVIELAKDMDADYRTILTEMEDYYEEDLPNDPEGVAEEIMYHYLLTIIKGLMNDLRDYSCHDSSYFENLTN